MRWAIAACIGVLALTGCGGAYDIDVPLSMPPSRLPPSAPINLAVVLVVPQGSQALQVASVVAMQPCGNAFNLAPAPYGGTFLQTMEDRLSRSFRLAGTVASVSWPIAANAIIEARLDDIAFRIGCGFNETYDVAVTGSLRAIAPDGRELWRSNLTRKQLALPKTGLTEAMGRGASSAMAVLIEEWVAELRVQSPSRIAFDPSTRHAAAPAPAPVPAPAPAPAPTAPPTRQAPPPARFAEQPVVTRFPRGAERPDDIAVIIGNADYSRLGKDIPDVRPAHADAEGIRLYATQALGIKDGNLILLKDATGSQMTRVFGSDKDHRGQLFDWVKPGRSRVFVYYSGHGAPGSQGGSPYLIPTDADAARIELNGYPLKTLYGNLGKLPADSVTVVLEACFSGVSSAGSVIGNASPVFFEVKAPSVPANLTVIAAGAANQMANWELDGSSGLFTKYFLEGMAGKADIDKDGKVTLDELDRYLKDTLTYHARRYYGRDQQAQIISGSGR